MPCIQLTMFKSLVPYMVPEHYQGSHLMKDPGTDPEYLRCDSEIPQIMNEIAIVFHMDEF